MVEVRFADTLTNLRNGETRNGAEPWPLTSLRSNLNCLFATTQRILRKCSTSSGVRDSSSYIRTTAHAAVGPRCHITDSFDTMPSNSGETAQANPRFKEPQCQLHTHTSTTHTVETNRTSPRPSAPPPNQTHCQTKVHTNTCSNSEHIYQYTLSRNTASHRRTFKTERHAHEIVRRGCSLFDGGFI